MRVWLKRQREDSAHGLDIPVGDAPPVETFHGARDFQKLAKP